LLPCCPPSSPHVCTAGCTAAAVRRTADASSLHRLRCTSYGTGPPHTVHQSTCTTHRTCSVTAVVSTRELSPTHFTTFKLVDQTSHGLVELVLVLFRRTHNAAWSSNLESFPALYMSYSAAKPKKHKGVMEKCSVCTYSSSGFSAIAATFAKMPPQFGSPGALPSATTSTRSLLPLPSQAAVGPSCNLK
jgi:hypothetical protein